MIRLLVVDDHVPTRDEIIRHLSQGGLIKIVGEAQTSDDAYKIAKELLPDIVLLDLHLPGLISTPDLIKRLIALRNVKVVMFASQGKASEVQDLLDTGASGYVLKTDSPTLIRMALLMVSRGSRGVISPSLPRHLTRLSAQDRAMLREVTGKGKLPKAAERMGIMESKLAEMALELALKLELSSIEDLIKWAKRQGF